MEIVKGALYIVGTPIGNLSDISERAIHVLKNVDFIAAEDTRVSGLLLSRLCGNRKHSARTSLVSCHEHNIKSKSVEIVKRLKDGESCALVTDAGMPCISDPGEELVSLCAEHDIPVYVVPGPCALTAALSISGLSAKRFSFEGFLSVANKQRTTHLNSLKDSRYTLIFYEAPHKLLRTLSDLQTALGDRKIAVCRELTKIYEEVLRGKISEMIALYENKTPKGEYVLVVEGCRGELHSPANLAEAVESALELHHSGESLSQATKTIAEQTGLKKSELYKETLKLKEKNND